MIERGVATAPYLPSIHLQPYMRERYGFREGCCRCRRTAARARSRCRSTAGSTRDDQEYVVETLRTVLQ